MTVEPLVLGLELPSGLGDIDGTLRDPNSDAPYLTRMMQFEFITKRHSVGGETFGRHCGQCLLTEFVEPGIDICRWKSVERTSEHSGEVLADVGVQHAYGAQRSRITRYIDLVAAQTRPDSRAMHRSSPASSHKSEAAR